VWPDSPGRIIPDWLHCRRAVCQWLLWRGLLDRQLNVLLALFPGLATAATGLPSPPQGLSQPCNARIDEEGDEDADWQCGVRSDDSPLAPVKGAVDLQSIEPNYKSQP